MEITKVKNGGSMEFKLTGRLDTNTAPELTEAVKATATEELSEVILRIWITFPALGCG